MWIWGPAKKKINVPLVIHLISIHINFDAYTLILILNTTQGLN